MTTAAIPQTRKTARSHRVRNLLIVLLVFMMVAGVGGVLVMARRGAQVLLHPGRHTIDTTPAEYRINDWEDVSFTSSDGLRLVGWFMPPAPDADGATLIFLHGFGGTRTGLLAQAAMLHELGYGALLFDLRNHGESEGTVTTMAYLEPLDVEGALTYLETRDDVNMERIAVIGESLGAATAIRAGAAYPEIRAVIAEAGFSSLEDNVEEGVRRLANVPPFPFAPLVVWFAESEVGVSMASVRPVDDITRISPRPVLLLHGSDDGLIDVSNSERMYAAAGEPKQLVIFEGAHHGNLFGYDESEFTAVVVPFLDQYVMEGVPEPG